MVLGLRSFLVGACGRCSEGSGDSGGFSESAGQTQGGACGKVREGRTRSSRSSFASRLHVGLGRARSAGAGLRPSLPSAPHPLPTHAPSAPGGTRNGPCPQGAPTLTGSVTPGRERRGSERGYRWRQGREVRVQEGAVAPAWGGAGPKGSVGGWAEACHRRGQVIPGGGNARAMFRGPRRVCVAASLLPEGRWVRGPDQAGLKAKMRTRPAPQHRSNGKVSQGLPSPIARHRPSPGVQPAGVTRSLLPHGRRAGTDRFLGP